MDRREFIKSAGVAVALPAITITCKYKDDEKGPEKESSSWKRWDYRVYCYEREQGEWVFSQNIRGSFDYQREYMTAEEDQSWPYAGWMDQGKLHFASLDDATDFIDCHVRTKDDLNIKDSIYDVYYIKRDEYYVSAGEEPQITEKEIQVAHYWFNGDTGSQIHWEQDGFNTDWNKVESA